MGGRDPVDIVGIILALALALLALLILVATTVQIIYNSRPEVQLSDNATQVLTGAVGALTGLLGGYIGARTRGRP